MSTSALRARFRRRPLRAPFPTDGLARYIRSRARALTQNTRSTGDVGWVIRGAVYSLLVGMRGLRCESKRESSAFVLTSTTLAPSPPFDTTREPESAPAESDETAIAS